MIHDDYENDDENEEITVKIKEHAILFNILSN